MSKWKKPAEEKRLRGSAGVARANRVKLKAGYKCAKCGILTTELEADHVIPLCKGGKDDESNLKALCIPCHAEKSKRERMEGFREKVAPRAQIGIDGWPVDEVVK